MFKTIFFTTVKNLFRSVIFRLLLAILVIIAVYEATGVMYNYYDPALGEVIYDNDPRYILQFNTYVQTVMNACVSNVMMYGMPLFTVVSTVIILFRDYVDGFFEIEKSCGMRPAVYLGGRMAALITVNTVTAFLAVMLSLYVFVFTRGGVEGVGILSLLADSVVRVIRVTVFIALPCILLYIALTYGVGSIFSSGIPAAVAGLGYAVFYYVANLMFRFRLAPVYFDYMSPLPQKPRTYFHYYGTDMFENVTQSSGVALWQVILAIGCLVTLSLLYTAVSYIRIRKRNI